MDTVPLPLLCKAYIANGRPEMITDEMLAIVRGDAELTNMVLRKDYAELAVKLLWDLPSDRPIPFIGPKTMEEYAKQNGAWSKIWAAAIACGTEFSAMIDLTERDVSKLVAPHDYLPPDSKVTVNTKGYCAVGRGWNLTVLVSRGFLLECVVNSEKFRPDCYDKAFARRATMHRILSRKLELSVDDVYGLLGREGVAHYLVAGGEATDWTLEILAEPDEEVDIFGEKFDKNRPNYAKILAMLAKEDLDRKKGRAVKFMDYLCSISHFVLDGHVGERIVKKAQACLLEADATTDGAYYRSMNAAISAFSD